jgi:DNA-binding CsgD family transcriptional regulator
MARARWFSNPAGQKLIGHGLSTVQERLTTRFAPDRDALQGALARVLDGTPDDFLENPRPVLVRSDDSDQFLAVYVLPVRLPTGHAVEQIFAGARALVLVTTSKPGEPPDPTIVRDILGLTLGEARIAALVGFGLAPREAAERLKTTEETARTTLKRVFSKVGVSRQSELATLLTRLVLR